MDPLRSNIAADLALVPIKWIISWICCIFLILSEYYDRYYRNTIMITKKLGIAILSK